MIDPAIVVLGTASVGIGVVIGASLSRWARSPDHRRQASLAPSGPAVEQDAHWGIECSAERLQVLIREPGFHEVMRLARIVNAMRFGQAALYHARDDDGPVGIRSRSSGFFFHASILFEGLQLIPELRQMFGTHGDWERSFGTFGSDEDVRALVAQGTLLHRIRNHVGAHVLAIVPERSLPRLDMPRYVLVRAHGPAVGAVHYQLADEMALHYVLERPSSFSELLREFELQGSEVTALLMRFLDAADILIPRALGTWGLAVRFLATEDDE